VAYRWSFLSQLFIFITLKETYICDSGLDFEGDVGKWDETAELCNHLDQDLGCEGVRETAHL
jgi:hypothetical protein